MTDARVEPIPADPASARIFLDQAERVLADADGPISLDSKQLLYWQACISMLEAILLTAGRRVTAGSAGVASELGVEELRRAAVDLLDVARSYVTRR